MNCPKKLVLVLVCWLLSGSFPGNVMAKGGATTGSDEDNTTAGALVEAAVGGVAGEAICVYMDKLARDLTDEIQGAETERLSEGIKMTIPAEVLFDSGSSSIKPSAEPLCSKLADLLSKYPNTHILIQGHLDENGLNTKAGVLSVKRAASVFHAFKSRGVAGGRISAAGYGSARPVASNTTEMGRRANRRIEIAIFADNRLKQTAQDNKQL